MARVPTEGVEDTCVFCGTGDEYKDTGVRWDICCGGTYFVEEQAKPAQEHDNGTREQAASLHRTDNALPLDTFQRRLALQ